MRSLEDLENELRSLSIRQRDAYTEEQGWVGGPQGPMFYLLTVPSGVSPRGCVVVCPSIFELATLQPVESLFIRRAAERGYAGIYLQPAGVGESGGDPGATRMASRVAAAHIARELLEERSPGAPVCFLGARWGAAVAARAAGTVSEPAGLILWDPLFDPDVYIAQIRRLARISGVAGGNVRVHDPFQRLQERDRVSIMGTETNRAQIEDLSSWHVGDLPVGGPVLAVVLSNRSEDAARARLAAIEDVEVVQLHGRDMAGLGMSTREAPEAIEPTLAWIDRISS